jgi:hypothetical protein
MRLSLRSTIVLAALMLALAATSLVSAAQPATPQPGTPQTGTPIDHPTGTGEIVLRVEMLPGFVPVEFALTMMPTFTLYGDGRVVVQGPQTLQFPGPALPNLLTFVVTEDGIQSVLAMAREAGLLDGDRHLANDMVTDLPTTVITTDAGGRRSVVSVYGLGVAEESLSGTERAERARLAEVVGRLTSLAVSLPADQIAAPETSYPIERLQIISRVAEPTLATPDDPSLTRTIAEWPLAQPLADLGEPVVQAPIENADCAVVSGADAAELVAALAAQNALTLWRSQGEIYEVFARPLLVDEAGCTTAVEGTPAATPTA